MSKSVRAWLVAASVAAVLGIITCAVLITLLVTGSGSSQASAAQRMWSRLDCTDPALRIHGDYHELYLCVAGRLGQATGNLENGRKDPYFTLHDVLSNWPLTCATSPVTAHLTLASDQGAQMIGNCLERHGL